MVSIPDTTRTSRQVRKGPIADIPLAFWGTAEYVTDLHFEACVRNVIDTRDLKEAKALLDALSL